MDTSRDGFSLTLPCGTTSSSPYTSTSSDESGSVAAVVDTSFTMRDVFQELEQLKCQVTTSTNGYIPPMRHRNKFGKDRRAVRMKKSRSKSKNSTDDPRLNSVATLNPWSHFNKEVSFIHHALKLRALSDEEVLNLAWAEIGKRIAYHKENKIDRTKATVLIYVLQCCKKEEIEVLERKLFPFSPRMLLAIEKM
ncbi:hypothetical protein CAEBREN_12486 [Caenorhabditis brenneri]|uniref:Uncharacterized protein n=1 Tax=Caenorhabditis brenneri TaxID=135651 RepID=G0MSS8_CAEBE|nr:hypothetical protein CAEBREN_12486 [Caenorhabditis brenneri]